MIEVKSVQIGITTRCNSHCYFCFREELKRAGRKEGNVDLPASGIKTVLDQGIKDIQLCCNRGEAIFHPDIDNIINMIKSYGSRFEMNTNGDNFDEKWWYDLGQKMTGGDQIIFALDGLKKTHEFYRDTNWNRVFSNVKAFIEGGGTAIWQMILFRHNENQVDLVKALAKSIGCKETWIINSRFYNDTYRKPKKEFGKTKEEILISNEFKKIECRFHLGKRVYIGVDGSVWPCCFTRCHFGFKERAYPNNTTTKLYHEERKHFNNIFNTPLNEIVNNSKMFKRVFDNMHNESVPYEPTFNGSFKENIDRPILYKNPSKERLLRHPRNMVNFACQLYCHDTPEMKKNRREIKN
jgi:MoaA/NifB/PqqE/SkfB family radical SAM enzyme